VGKLCTGSEVRMRREKKSSMEAQARVTLVRVQTVGVRVIEYRRWRGRRRVRKTGRCYKS